MGQRGPTTQFTRRLDVLCTPALVDRLRLLAEAQGVTINGLAREALAAYVSRPVGTVKRRTR